VDDKIEKNEMGAATTCVMALFLAEGDLSDYLHLVEEVHASSNTAFLWSEKVKLKVLAMP
jgi:hypothetical protein